MTPYERGQRDMQRRATEVCTTIATDGSLTPGKEALPAIYCAERILSLPIEGEADQRGAAAIPVAQQEEGRASLGVRAGKAAQSVPHHNPGEPVAQVMYEMANNGKCGLVVWFKSPRSLPDGTMLYAHPARPGPSQECVMVPVSTVKWLCGERAHPRTGLWFERPQGAGAYWWRSVLREDIAAAREE